MDGLIECGLVQRRVPVADFIIHPVAKITEPDPMPWFQGWSTGQFLVFTWSVLALFLTMFYTSNLRAHLVTIHYERPLESFQDIVDNGKKVYIGDGFARLRYDHNYSFFVCCT